MVFPDDLLSNGEVDGRCSSDFWRRHATDVKAYGVGERIVSGPIHSRSLG
jgi:hypothetical protein